jgi:hypothetical protein
VRLANWRRFSARHALQPNGTPTNDPTADFVPIGDNQSPDPNSQIAR